MMRSRNISLIVMLLSIIGCSKIFHEVTDEQMPSGEWKFCMTKGGVSMEDTLTIRASIVLHNFDTLVADGAYCRYKKIVDEALLWYYPCRVNDETGTPLDSYGNPIDWTDPDAFDHIDKDSKYALRAPANQNYDLVLSSPAVRMERFINNAAGNKMDTVRYGYRLDRNDELFISDPLKGLSVSAVWIDDNYVYSVSDTKLYDRRSKVTVKVACGALRTADVHSVHFRNVMTSAYYMPITRTYEQYVMDGGYADPTGHYTANTYSTVGVAGIKVVGDMLHVPDDEQDIHLIQRKDETEVFTEWDKSSNSGTIVTAIADFPVFSLDYSAVYEDQYKYKGLIPEVVVYSGQSGNIRSTVSLPVNFEPMKSYTVIIYISSAYVNAELYVTDWVDGNTQNVTFGDAVELSGTSVEIDDWLEKDISDGGNITNTQNE